MTGLIGKSLFGALAALALSAASGQAAVLYASNVDDYTQGTGVVASRAVTAKALGAADGAFLSLGLGGSATFNFGGLFTAPGAIFEVTFGNVKKHKEAVDVFGILSGVATFIGNLTNAQNGVFNFIGKYDQLRLVDTSPFGGGSTDGYDIDAISVTPAAVPLPAGGLLLLGALGLGVASRRRRG